jgi:hypothetical protein
MVKAEEESILALKGQGTTNERHKGRVNRLAFSFGLQTESVPSGAGID